MPETEVRKEGFISQLLTMAAVGGLLVFIFAVPWLQNAGTYKKGLSGKIVDKKTTFLESKQGSSVDRKLIIEEVSGKRTPVFVNERVFGQAEIGMRFERSQAGDQVRSADSFGR